MVLDFYFSLIAACEFLSGTKKQAEELGTRWIDEIKEEFTFAILCRGDTKVIYLYKQIEQKKPNVCGRFIHFSRSFLCIFRVSKNHQVKPAVCQAMNPTPLKKIERQAYTKRMTKNQHILHPS